MLLFILGYQETFLMSTIFHETDHERAPTLLYKHKNRQINNWEFSYWLYSFKGLEQCVPQKAPMSGSNLGALQQGKKHAAP